MIIWRESKRERGEREGAREQEARERREDKQPLL